MMRRARTRIAAATLVGCLTLVGAASADKLIAIDKNFTKRGDCLEHAINVDANTPRNAIDKNQLNGTTLTWRFVPTPNKGNEPVKDTHRDDVSAMFIAYNNSYSGAFSDNPAVGTRTGDLLANPGMIDYYYCPSVGVLKFGTGKDFGSYQPTLIHELEKGAGSMLHACSHGDRAKVIVCPVLASSASVEQIELAWRRFAKTANHEMEINTKKMVPGAPDLDVAYAGGLLGTSGLNVSAGAFAAQLANLKTICIAAEKSDAQDRGTGKGALADLRLDTVNLCRAVKAVIPY